jgi:hypothetical protein
MTEQVSTNVWNAFLATYTSHSWRRTSATVGAEGGMTLQQLKKLGGWQSTKVAEEYIENSNKMKNSNASKFIIDSEGPVPPNAEQNLTLNFNSSSNIQINFNARGTKRKHQEEVDDEESESSD